MESEKERQEYAQWILERNLHWISAAEVKAGAVVAIDTAMLGALAAAFSVIPSANRTGVTNLSSLVAAACLLIALFCVAMSVLPRTDGPTSSFVFFGKIVKHTAADYADTFRRATTGAFLDNCLDQVYRNAQIACAKFGWVRYAMMWSFGAVLPWVAALACLMKA